MGALLSGGGTVVGIVFLVLGVVIAIGARKAWRAGSGVRDRLRKAAFERTNEHGAQAFSDWDAVKQAERDAIGGSAAWVGFKYLSVAMWVVALSLILGGGVTIVGSLAMGSAVSRAESGGAGSVESRNAKDRAAYDDYLARHKKKAAN